MKRSMLLAFEVVFTFATVLVRADDASQRTVAWQPVIEGKMATVSVANALFEQKEGKYFIAGMRVTNKTDREIGVDLRSRRYCVRINQWTAIDTSVRTIGRIKDSLSEARTESKSRE